jgi:hypothetical protein
MSQTEQQVDRILGIVHTIALDAIELPPSRRRPFIKQEIRDLRHHYSMRYCGDQVKLNDALEFSDKLEEWVLDAIRRVEDSGNHVSRA